MIPWARGPEQLIQYVEKHYLNGGSTTAEDAGDVA